MKMRFAAAAMMVFATPAFAQAPDAMKRSDPGAGNSIQCWDTQALVVRDRNTSAQQNDTSAVAGQKQRANPGTTGSTSTPTRPATRAEAANAKRPPGISDC
jgi:hypothetical protein